ncbi:MAG: permease prefix domain 1-containing protein [Planctomycetota bacterium]|nr:permease prefix domain 1-containing protein [Planctomycetota bacterium]
MPEHEFEIYLSVLSRLVKLSPDQKASIADELRDHLEERFTELVRSGHERDVAIRQALDEFGDASGLALDLTTVSKKRIPRWVIRSTAFTATVAMLALAWVFLFAPPDMIPNAPGIAAGQGGKKPAPSENVEQAVPVVAKAATRSAKLILDEGPDDLAAEFLAKPIVLEFVDTPLKDVAQQIGKWFGVPVIIDQNALNDNGIPLDEPITLSVGTTPITKPENIKRDDQGNLVLPKGVWALPLSDVLSIMLDQHGMTWYVEDGILHLTTKDHLSEIQQTRTYDVVSILNVKPAPSGRFPARRRRLQSGNGLV